MEIKIREYEKSDYEGLLKLLNNVYSSKISRATLEEQYINENRKILIAVDDIKVVGCTFVEIQEDCVRPRRSVFVTYVAVDEAYRKRGIGRKLYSEVERICKNSHCSAVEFTSANFRKEAHAFYQSLGYSKKDTTLFIKEANDMK